MVLPLALFSLRSLVTGPALVLPFISLAFQLACCNRARNSDLHPCSHLHSSTSALSYPDALTSGDADNYHCTGGATVAPAYTVTPGTITTPAATRTARPASTLATSSTLWRGLTVTPEDRCSRYDQDDYSYSPSVEPRIADAQGGVYGPYTGAWFGSIRVTDIEHIVARSVAHDSGLCPASPATKDRFASDLLNLTLASPIVNRHQKSDKDAAEWIPALNECWYVTRIIEVRRKYGLTIDRPEADAIDAVLAGCQLTEMVMLSPGQSVATTTPTPASNVATLALYDDNGNGRITCAEARAYGIAPVRRGHPAYQSIRDADGDGVVCE